MSTLKEVGRAAGVSVATAGRILRGDLLLVVRPATRERVLAVAERLDYRPNRIASGLRTRRTGTIALFLPDPQNFMWSEMVIGVERATARDGYLVVLADAHGPTLDPDHFGRLVLERRVDGLLVAFAHIDDRLVSQLGTHGLPLLPINSRSHAIDASVTMDDASGSALAVRHLHGLGHRRIGYVAGRPDTDVGRRREQGYREEMDRLGLVVEPAWVASGEFTEVGGQVAARRILDVESGDRPTALYVANFFSTLGVIGVVRHLGLQVPTDISIVTMDDHLVAEHLAPPLTTIRMPMRSMGEAGGEMLLRAIDGRPLSHLIVETPPVLVVRQSSAPPPS